MLKQRSDQAGLLSAKDQRRRDQVGIRWRSVRQGLVVTTMEGRLPGVSGGEDSWDKTTRRKKLLTGREGEPRVEGLLGVRSIGDEGKHKRGRDPGPSHGRSEAASTAEGKGREGRTKTSNCGWLARWLRKTARLGSARAERMAWHSRWWVGVLVTERGKGLRRQGRGWSSSGQRRGVGRGPERTVERWQ